MGIMWLENEIIIKNKNEIGCPHQTSTSNPSENIFFLLDPPPPSPFPPGHHMFMALIKKSLVTAVVLIMVSLTDKPLNEDEF